MEWREQMLEDNSGYLYVLRYKKCQYIDMECRAAQSFTFGSDTHLYIRKCCTASMADDGVLADLLINYGKVQLAGLIITPETIHYIPGLDKFIAIEGNDYRCNYWGDYAVLAEYVNSNPDSVTAKMMLERVDWEYEYVRLNPNSTYAQVLIELGYVKK